MIDFVAEAKRRGWVKAWVPCWNCSGRGYNRRWLIGPKYPCEICEGITPYGWAYIGRNRVTTDTMIGDVTIPFHMPDTPRKVGARLMSTSVRLLV